VNRRDEHRLFTGYKEATVSKSDRYDWVDIFQAIGCPTIIMDAHHRVLAANRATFELTGKQPSELIGLRCCEVFHSPNSKHPPAGCPMQKLLAGEAAPTVEMEMEAFRRVCLVSCTPIYDDKGDIEHIIHIATDITEHRRMERELGRQNRYLSQLNAFAIDLAHLTPEGNTEELIAKKLCHICHASAVTVSVYDPLEKALFVKYVEADSGIIQQATKLLGTMIENIPIKVDNGLYQEMIRQGIGVKQTLTEVTFGGISPTVGRAISRLLKADRYIGIAYLIDDRLYGTSVLAMPKGIPDPPFEILRSFSHMATLALHRKMAAEALRISEEKYRLLIETMSEGVVVVDNYDKVQYINSACCRIFGFKPEDVIGKTGYEVLIHPDDWNTIKYKNASRLSGHVDTYDVRGLRVNGDSIWLRISGAPIRDKQGMVVGSVGIMSDVTQSKAFEDELRLQNAFLDGFIEGAAEAIVVLDKDENVLRINREFTRIFEYKPKEAVGKRINDLIVPEELKDEGAGATAKVAEGKKIYLETLRQSKGGKRIDVSVLGNPIKLEGDQVGVVGIYRDITEKVQLERQLRQSQRLESIGQLAGGVAHDFNNMLTVILGYGEDLQQEFEPGSPQWHEVGEIIKAGQRARNLTSQLLAFSRKQMIKPRLLNLNRVIEDMQQMMRRLIGEDIALVTNLASDLGMVKADIGQIEQVLLNLVVNARDAMSNGGKITIETANFTLDRDYAKHHISAQPGEYVMLGVSDTGIGMDDETKNRLFEPFFTTKDKSTSSGLGLPTVYGIVKQAGGTIWVYSEPGKGSYFKILLPHNYDSTNGEIAPPAKRIYHGKGEHILVVEDEPALRTLITKVIQKLGYVVTVVANGAEAIDIVKEQELRPDLVITDVVMPGMNGKELADLLRLHIPELKVLLMSGYTDEIIAKRGVLEPDIPFLQKPFSREQIAEKIQNILHGKEDNTI